MTEECACGFRPPGDCNPDCERCTLISTIAELEAKLHNMESIRFAFTRRGVLHLFADEDAKNAWVDSVDNDWGIGVVVHGIEFHGPVPEPREPEGGENE